MRDPLAEKPESILHQHQFSANDLQISWTPYQSLEPAIILKRAIALLAPADQTSLSLDGSKLLLAGIATEAWLKRAKLMQPAIAGITSMESDQLILTDSADYLLQLARQQLKPPPTVQLSMEGTRLLAKGSAAHAWIAHATSAVVKIPAISAYDDSAVIDLDSDAYLLSEAIKLLAPPSSVKLKVEQAHLYARGRASSQWNTAAKQQAQQLNGIKSFNTRKLSAITHGLSDRQLLKLAKHTLLPPESVTLKVEQRILSVSGIASKAWANRAINSAKTIKGLQGYDQSELQLVESALLALKRELNSVQLQFKASSNQLEPGEEAKITRLSRLLKKQKAVIEIASAHINITGYSGLLHDRAHTLALSRAQKAAGLMKQQGIASSWIHTKGQKQRASEWSVELDLTWNPLP